MPAVPASQQNLDLGFFAYIPAGLSVLAGVVTLFAVVNADPLSAAAFVAVMAMLAAVSAAWAAGSINLAAQGGKASAGLLGVAYAATLLSAATVFAGSGWCGVVGGIIGAVAALLGTGLRSLYKPARCRPTDTTMGMLNSIKTVNWSPATGVGGGLPLCSDAAGRLSLIGEVAGGTENYEDTAEFEEFAALLQRVRKSSGAGQELGGVVILTGVHKFGPLNVKDADSVTVCSVSQLSKALSRKQR